MIQINNDKPLVGILMGSASDAPTMQKAADVLTKLQITHEVKVASAHRTPKRVMDYTATAHERGVRVIIAAAGLAAHLAGVVAAHTPLPVLGVPMPGGLANGLDALLSTVQMPKGTPVATFTVGSHGAVNAAIFAAQILSLSDPEVAKRLAEYRRSQSAAVPEEPPAPDPAPPGSTPN